MLLLCSGALIAAAVGPTDEPKNLTTVTTTVVSVYPPPVYPPPVYPPPPPSPSPPSPQPPSPSPSPQWQQVERVLQNDNMWICTLRHSMEAPWSNMSCGSDVSIEKHMELAFVVHPVKETVGPGVMAAVPGGCCMQTALLDSDRSDNLESPSLLFMSRLNAGLIVKWSKENKVCGLQSQLAIIVGWNMYAPPAFSIFGCNPGPSGVALPPMCRC
ncbi:hypothetical protein FOA52_010452 [Chlamydomonas sp. UWO 241]|nr:hypothetical protein FOA52_010452 [Chlamydomonas sp. UWO 241]